MNTSRQDEGDFVQQSNAVNAYIVENVRIISVRLRDDLTVGC